MLSLGTWIKEERLTELCFMVIIGLQLCVRLIKQPVQLELHTRVASLKVASRLISIPQTFPENPGCPHYFHKYGFAIEDMFPWE